MAPVFAVWLLSPVPTYFGFRPTRFQPPELKLCYSRKALANLPTCPTCPTFTPKIFKKLLAKFCGHAAVAKGCGGNFASFELPENNPL
jgi:hypothetical protein